LSAFNKSSQLYHVGYIKDGITGAEGAAIVVNIKYNAGPLVLT